ncbi:sigma-70 family RNA polymerase sigma factor [Solirubrobacter ginsenosidimutans]|uniref:Sigma-70 family RNA polymerase sigma factor n=1 Tax=Solirubrobacter ginsenosidimutans TaxID=490573 RepID=A0A9X3MT66_9ACTN|nr:sigma-70 family RNA polymerase sigma factor [Solirubrobacter ginsenosidimutans]MDA0160773.1 sigma-70 family RNA polymerase sigma factor [Solirubrobacter ginsenosidimutans]
MTAVPATLRIRREGTLRLRAARGDGPAFAAIYARHHQALYRYCRSILRHDEDAQDALQSTMMRAFAALQDEQRDFELRPWLFRIAHNEAITILRRRRETDELDEQPAPGDLEDRVADREELRLLQLDLADLPERQRAALILRELNGLSHAEIGVVLELSPGAVKQAIFEARSALFSFREGREMACHDIRSMLSDGDGRVLRGRGVRGHLRECTDCRRFKADVETRPKALRALAPPLPVGGAAALLAQILGGGATAAKLLACIAIAGSGTTLAVEMQHAREPVRTPTAETLAPAKAKPPHRPTAVLPVVASTPQPANATPTATRGPDAKPAKAKATPASARSTTRTPRRSRPRQVAVQTPAPAPTKPETQPLEPRDDDEQVTPAPENHVQADRDDDQKDAAKEERKASEQHDESEATKAPPGQQDRANASPGQEEKAKVPPGQQKKSADSDAEHGEAEDAD